VWAFPPDPLTHPFQPQHTPFFADAEDFYKLNDLALLAQIALADAAAAGAGEPLKHTQYLRKFGGLKVTGAALVAALDYMDVVKYLRGEVATADQVRACCGLGVEWTWLGLGLTLIRGACCGLAGTRRAADLTLGVGGRILHSRWLAPTGDRLRIQPTHTPAFLHIYPHTYKRSTAAASSPGSAPAQRARRRARRR